MTTDRSMTALPCFSACSKRWVETSPRAVVVTATSQVVIGSSGEESRTSSARSTTARNVDPVWSSYSRLAKTLP